MGNLLDFCTAHSVKRQEEVFCHPLSETELTVPEVLQMADGGASERPMEKSLPNVYPLQ